MNVFTRRRFIQGCGAGLALRALDAFAFESASQPPGRMIVLFLRGGLDGLFAISPVADPRLPDVRPSLARSVLAKGTALGASGFAAHPSAKVLADLFIARELSFAPCAGTVDTSRSHFQAQDIFELGSGTAQGNSGFMARAAQALDANAGAISFTREVPLCFSGSEIPPEVAPLSGSGLKLPEGRLLQAIRRRFALPIAAIVPAMRWSRQSLPKRRSRPRWVAWSSKPPGVRPEQTAWARRPQRWGASCAAIRAWA